MAMTPEREHRNYNKAKADPCPGLPDPLLLLIGKGGRPGEWWNGRHPELVELFDHESLRTCAGERCRR